MAKRFNRRSFMQERHNQAKAQRQFFKENFKDQPLPKYSDFLKNETPLEQKIVSYDVSFQVSYRGTSDAFESTPKTFKVFGFVGQEAEIEKRTMNMVLDSKGQMTKANFPSSTLEMIEKNTDVKVSQGIKPRGMEKSYDRVSRKQASEVMSKGFYVESLDDSFKFKNKKDREGLMKLDVTHFM
jgi:hypothetical protein